MEKVSILVTAITLLITLYFIDDYCSDPETFAENCFKIQKSAMFSYWINFVLKQQDVTLTATHCSEKPNETVLVNTSHKTKF